MRDTQTSRHPDPTARRSRTRWRTLAFLAIDATAWVGGFVAAAWTRYEFALTTTQLTRAAGCGLIAAGLHVAVAGARPLGTPPARQPPGGTRAGRNRPHHHRDRPARRTAGWRTAGAGEHAAGRRRARPAVHARRSVRLPAPA
ncbi:hypothetical protein [Verrucosispora sioxanthis]|uniref:hypothetical protein n=1 Tax=Verrucosispora sioxanthis TaxID=2499994 RepID=UPI00209CBB0F|nr:hypothetical protein [Verrucosispora sioxanthis]